MSTPKRKAEDRFWGLVDRSQFSPGGCWLWLGGRDKRFADENARSFKAHVFSFILAGGNWLRYSKPIFLCGDNSCVQPAHVYIQSDEERFWSGVDKSAGPTGCWTWQRSKEAFGRGRFHTSVHGAITAHRFAFLTCGGVLTDERPWVLHKCHEFGFPDNRACCNPAHLRAGTPSENTEDSLRAGTQRQIRKTHCPKGHPLSGDNLVANHLKRGMRDCKKCYTDNARVAGRIRRGWDPVAAATTLPHGKPVYKKEDNA